MKEGGRISAQKGRRYYFVTHHKPPYVEANLGLVPTFAELWGHLQRTQATRYTGTCIPIGFMVAYSILILRIVKRFMGILPVFGVLAPLRSVFLPSPVFSWV